MTSPRSTARLRQATGAALVANIGIVFTGGLVRVTASGLGCPSWPTCDGQQVMPRPGTEHAGWHAALEFGNRLLSFVVLATVVWALVEVRRTRPHLQIAEKLAWALTAGVLVQAVVGGITVRLALSPLWVMTHFLLSIILIALAVILHERANIDRVPPEQLEHPTYVVRALATALLAAGAVLVVLGTLVTGAGPHAGDPGTPRLGIDIRTAAQAHGSAMWVTIALLLATTVSGWAWVGSRLRRALLVLIAIVVAQGALGYTQYALDLPEPLVAAHILGAALFWTALTTVWVRTRPLPVMPWRPQPPDRRVTLGS